MKTHQQQPQTVSQRIPENTKAANQAPAEQILQRYKNRILQRQQANEEKEPLQGKFITAQREEMEDEELLQGKFENTAQLMEQDEEELLQGKFDTAQREGIDDEELLQGKFSETAQLIEQDEDELLQGKFDTAQREEMEDEELLQGKFSETTQLQETENAPLESKGENNTGLPNDLKTGIENLSGYSMDDVHVHYNSDKPAQLQALAYTQGTDIHVAPGQEKHLPHETWHVVQQKQGRVQPTMQLQGVNVNDNEGLEKEADVMGSKFIIQRMKASRLGTETYTDFNFLTKPEIINYVRIYFNDNARKYIERNKAGQPLAGKSLTDFAAAVLESIAKKLSGSNTHYFTIEFNKDIEDICNYIRSWDVSMSQDDIIYFLNKLDTTKKNKKVEFIGLKDKWHVHKNIGTQIHLKNGKDERSRKSLNTKEDLMEAAKIIFLTDDNGAPECYNWIRAEYIDITGEDLPASIRKSLPS